MMEGLLSIKGYYIEKALLLLLVLIDHTRTSSVDPNQTPQNVIEVRHRQDNSSQAGLRLRLLSVFLAIFYLKTESK